MRKDEDGEIEKERQTKVGNLDDLIFQNVNIKYIHKKFCTRYTK